MNSSIIYDKISKYVKITGKTVEKFDGEKRYYSTGNIGTENFEYVSYTNKPSRANLEVKENDILIAKMQNTNKTTIIDNDMVDDIYSTGFMSLRANNMNYKYLFYLLQSPEFIIEKDLNSYGTTQKAINDDRFRTIKIHFINNLDVQKNIVNYLDEKIKILDKVILKNKEIVNSLEELKRSTIIELSFHGIDKDKEKDSNIDYIGKIPSSWRVCNLFEYVSENKLKNKGMINNNLLSLSYGKIIKKDINSNEGLLPESFETYQVISPNSIILRLTDLQNDKKSLRVGHCYEEGIITSAYVNLNLNSKELSSEYLYYLLHSYDLCKVFYNMGTGVRQSLNYSELRRMKILVPPFNEQEKIVNTLNQKCKEIDKIINIKNRIVSNIEMYKSSLIYEAVTGKIEV